MAILKNYHDSSMISYTSYDKEKLLLTVEFTGGNTYEYYDVDEDTYNGLCAASSVGKYFLSTIRNHYAYNQI